MLIEDYALVGDLQSAALISTAGDVDWLCVPRFDSPSCFAALVGDTEHGRWRIAPPNGAVADVAPLPARHAGAGDRLRDRERRRSGHRLHAGARQRCPAADAHRRGPGWPGANGILQQMVQPIAYGAALGLHPLAVLIVTIAGGSLFGR
jgi:hypothetical protein